MVPVFPLPSVVEAKKLDGCSPLRFVIQEVDACGEVYSRNERLVKGIEIEVISSGHPFLSDDVLVKYLDE